MDNEHKQPGSPGGDMPQDAFAADALDAVEAVIHTSTKKGIAASLFPYRGDTKRERRRKTILDISLLLVFVCTIVLVWVVVIDPNSHGSLMKDLREAATAVTQAPDPNEPTKEPAEQPRIRLTDQELMEMNGDYVGWLRAPGGDIDMPVVQTANNNYYLYRNFERKPSRYGNPFLDFRVSLDPKSTNLIIYGHHMSDGTIFTKLLNYQQVDTVKKNPIITLELPTEILLFKIFAVVTVNGRPEHDNNYVFEVNTPEFPNRESFEGYIRQLEQRTYVKTGVDVKYGDTLICLQTCMYEFKDQYLYVIGRLVRTGESPSVNVKQIKRNPDPRLPQALLNKRGYENHYRNAENWQAPD